MSNFSLRYKYIFKQKDDEKKEKHQPGDIFCCIFSGSCCSLPPNFLHHQHDLVGNTQHQNHHVTNNNYEGHKQLILFALL